MLKADLIPAGSIRTFQRALDCSPNQALSKVAGLELPRQADPHWVRAASLALVAHAPFSEKGAAMRSDLVYSAGRNIENRFLLATVVSRAVRALHIDSTRTEDTANHVFSNVSVGRFAPLTLPQPATPALIEYLVIASAI